MNAEWVSVIIQIVLALGVIGAFYVNTIAQRKASAAKEHAETVCRAVEKTAREEIEKAEATAAADKKELCDKIEQVEKDSSRKLESAVSALYALLNGYGDRIARIEERLDSLPASAAVHEIAMQVRDLVGELKEMRAEVKGSRETLTAELNAVRESSKVNQATLARVEGFIRSEAGVPRR